MGGLIPTEVTAANILVLAPQGRIDSSNATAAEAEVLDHLNGHSRVVLDCAKLDYISSAGLRLVLIAAKHLKRSGGKLALCAMQPQVREVFDISGFASILTVVGTRSEAESAVGS